MLPLLTEWLPTTPEVRDKVAREARTLCFLDIAYRTRPPEERKEIASALLNPSGAKVTSYQFTVALFLAGVLLGAVVASLP